MSKPIETLSLPAGKGSTLNASIWENQVQRDRERFTTYSITIERRYRDGEDPQGELDQPLGVVEIADRPLIEKGRELP